MYDKRACIYWKEGCTKGRLDNMECLEFDTAMFQYCYEKMNGIDRYKGKRKKNANGTTTNNN
jgi:hypothetical protein